ncbi:hypothetical protein MPSEU_000804700 [Mayamaea pseudoterrestris]|nr:hypothetical protein MPSEU_000804700 [Mayamaea pseudoterrestris]
MMKRVEILYSARIIIMAALSSLASRRFATAAWSSRARMFSMPSMLPSIQGIQTTGSRTSSLRCAGSLNSNSLYSFNPGDKIQVEILSFGPLGASVDVLASSHEENDLIPEDAPALGSGLVLQREIEYFRQARGNIDVVRGEILPAYVERVRETGKIDVSLRAYGGEAKADLIGQQIMTLLQERKTLQVGDKSDPQEIEALFPGVSKKSFKRALSSLYKQRLVQVDKYSVSIIE